MSSEILPKFFSDIRQGISSENLSVMLLEICKVNFSENLPKIIPEILPEVSLVISLKVLLVISLRVFPRNLPRIISFVSPGFVLEIVHKILSKFLGI